MLAVCLLAAAVSAAAPPQPSFLEFRSRELVSLHELRVAIQRPDGYRRAGPVNRDATFSGHPYRVSLAAFVGTDAFVMVHAERVLDASGASDYSALPSFEFDGHAFRSRTLCAAPSPSEVAEEHDLRFLAAAGFELSPAVYVRQLFVTTEDHNAEVVITYGERLKTCPSPSEETAFREAFDKRMRGVVRVRFLR